MEITRCKWNWIGHTLRKSTSDKPSRCWSWTHRVKGTIWSRPSAEELNQLTENCSKQSLLERCMGWNPFFHVESKGLSPNKYCHFLPYISHISTKLILAVCWKFVTLKHSYMAPLPCRGLFRPALTMQDSTSPCPLLLPFLPSPPLPSPREPLRGREVIWHPYATNHKFDFQAACKTTKTN